MLAEIDYPSIIDAARSGAEWAWIAIYRDLSPGVLRYLRAHGARDPENLLGDVFVQVVRKLSGFQGDAREFRAWVFTISRNRLINQWYHDRRDPAQLAWSDSLPDPVEGGDVERDALERLGDEHVRAIISRLTPDQRDVVFLRIIAGMDIAQVARATGKSQGAVKSLQFRALAAIRRDIRKGAVSP